MNNTDDLNKYELLKSFLIANAKIKHEMILMRPPLDIEALNTDVIIKYTNNISDSLKYIIREFKKMASIYDDDNKRITNRIDELAKKWTDEFNKCSTDLNSLRAFYKNFITDMSLEVIETVKIECIGYTNHQVPKYSLKMCKTINELLHVMHCYVMNNDLILKDLNVIERTRLANNYQLTLYGKENAIAKKIIKEFPNNLDVGPTDIVSLADINKIFMMIKDRGHATTIEIDLQEDEVLIRYFIPKICDIDMINKLPGVKKVKEHASLQSATTGRFVTSKENLCHDLFKFIDMIPMYDNPKASKSTYSI